MIVRIFYCMALDVPTRIVISYPILIIFETKYSRMDQAKFVEDSFEKLEIQGAFNWFDCAVMFFYLVGFIMFLPSCSFKFCCVWKQLLVHCEKFLWMICLYVDCSNLSGKRHLRIRLYVNTCGIFIIYI